MAPVATLIVGALVVVVALAGGVVTITNPQTLPFREYVALLTGLAGAAGLLGVGRGLHALGREHLHAAAISHQDGHAPPRAQPARKVRAVTPPVPPSEP